MKRCLMFIFLFLGSMVSADSSLAGSSAELRAFAINKIAEKTYVNLSYIKFNENSIYYNFEGNCWLKIQSLHSDGSGFYILETDLLKETDNYKCYYKCPYCHAYVPEGMGCQNLYCPGNWRN